VLTGDAGRNIRAGRKAQAFFITEGCAFDLNENRHHIVNANTKLLVELSVSIAHELFLVCKSQNYEVRLAS
jgi:hypothetical protein